MKRYRLTKLKATQNGVAVTASSIDSYRSSDDLSPPVDYYVEGYPYIPPKVNSPLVFIRDNRNGVKIGGIMKTSTVIEISLAEDGVSQILETNNSVYLLKEL